MRFRLIATILCSATLFGCAHLKSQDTQIHMVNVQNLVTFSYATQFPVTAESPTEQLGYGILLHSGLVLTAQHVLPDDLNHLVIQDAGHTTTYLVQHIWIHPTQDLAVVQITGAGLSGSTAQPVAQPAEAGLFLTKKFAPLQSSGSISFLLDIVSTPGLSGSPVVDKSDQLIGIVSAQTDRGVIVEPRTTQMYDRMSSLQN